MVFYTSELRLNDVEYLRKSNRRFPTVLSMTNHIISNWNKVISDEDEVYILGGVGSAEYLKSLKGIKRLVMSSSDTLQYSIWRGSISSEPNDELDSELYEKYLESSYGVSSVNFGGRMVKKTSTGRLIRLITNPDYAKDDIFNIFGGVGDFQKMVHSGINCSIAVNNYFPISEVEIEYYMRNLDKLI